MPKCKRILRCQGHINDYFALYHGRTPIQPTTNIKFIIEKNNQSAPEFDKFLSLIFCLSGYNQTANSKNKEHNLCS